MEALRNMVCPDIITWPEIAALAIVASTVAFILYLVASTIDNWIRGRHYGNPKD
jgi:uncharacterized protein involved in cysteine biosynthesis